MVDQMINSRGIYNTQASTIIKTKCFCWKYSVILIRRPSSFPNVNFNWDRRVYAHFAVMRVSQLALKP